MANVNTNTSASGRGSFMRKVFLDAQGNAARSAHPDWQTLRFELFGAKRDADDKPIVVGTFDVARSDLPEAMAICAIGHGLSQKLGDTLAGVQKRAEADGFSYDPETGFADYMAGVLSDAWGDIVEGAWVSEREGSGGGANIRDLLEAIRRAHVAKNGEGADSEDWIAGVRAKLTDATSGEETRKAARSIPAVKAHLDAIALEKATERAKKSRADAKNADGLDMFSV